MRRAKRSLFRLTLPTLGVLASVGLLFVGSAAAQSRLYWTNNASGTIGTANRAGGEVVQKFFFASPEPYGIAADSSHVYWSDEGTDEIGRAGLGGTEIEASLIPAAGEVPEGMAVDGGHIYWANLLGQSIGRANLDGTSPEAKFIQLSAASFPEGVAVEGSQIYWTAAGHGGLIGRSNLAGGEKNEELITGLGGAISALAADQNHLYWSTNVGVGRATLAGAEVEPNFITGQTSVGGVAVDNAHVFWASFTTNRIGRAGLDGNNVEPSFITGAESPDTIAVSLNATSLTVSPPTMSITAGEDASVSATVAGGEATSGAIAFALYGPADPTCSAAPEETSSLPVSGNGPYQSPTVAPTTPGTYHWVVSYGGDPINEASGSACSDAEFTVTAAPTPNPNPTPTPNPTPMPNPTPTPNPTPALNPTPTTAPVGEALSALELLKVGRDRRGGTGNFRFEVPTAGTLTISGEGVRTSVQTFSAAGQYSVTLTPRGAFARRLRVNRRGFTKVEVSFAPANGQTVGFERYVRLVKR